MHTDSTQTNLRASWPGRGYCILVLRGSLGSSWEVIDCIILRELAGIYYVRYCSGSFVLNIEFAQLRRNGPGLTGT